MPYSLVSALRIRVEIATMSHNNGGGAFVCACIRALCDVSVSAPILDARKFRRSPDNRQAFVHLALFLSVRPTVSFRYAHSYISAARRPAKLICTINVLDINSSLLCGQ